MVGNMAQRLYSFSPGRQLCGGSLDEISPHLEWGWERQWARMRLDAGRCPGRANRRDAGAGPASQASAGGSSRGTSALVRVRGRVREANGRVREATDRVREATDRVREPNEGHAVK